MNINVFLYNVALKSRVLLILLVQSHDFAIILLDSQRKSNSDR